MKKHKIKDFLMSVLIVTLWFLIIGTSIFGWYAIISLIFHLPIF